MSNSAYTGFPNPTADTLVGTTLAANVTISSLQAVGTITTGVWNGTPIANAYIASAATWNAKQAALTLTTTGSTGPATLTGATLNIPQYAGASYTAGTGLTLTAGAFSVNTSQNIGTLSNLTTNGLMKTSGGNGTLGIAVAGTDYQAPLVSGTTIKTVNSTTLLGSGDIALQATLVSGTNIKTINGNSILGSGNLVISGGTNKFNGQLYVPATYNTTAYILTSNRIQFQINGLYGLQCTSGTVTLTVTKNGTNVTGLTNLNISSTPQDIVLGSAVVVAVGDAINYVWSGNNNAVDVRGTFDNNY